MKELERISLIAKTTIVLWALFAVCTQSFANTSSSTGAFVNAVPSARVTGMGMAYTGLADDGSSIFLNPAGLSLYGGGINVMSYQAFESSFTGIDFSMRLGSMMLGIGHISTSMADIPLTSYNTTTGRYEQTESFEYMGSNTAISGAVTLYNGYNTLVSVGGSLLVLQESLHENSAQGFTSVIGAAIKWDNTTVGISAKNLGASSMKWDTNSSSSYSLIEEFSAGLSTKVLDSILISADLKQKKGQDLSIHLGVESILANFVAIRAGYNNGMISYGTGIVLGELSINTSTSTPDAEHSEFLEPISKISIGYELRQHLPKPKRPKKRFDKKKKKSSSKFDVSSNIENLISNQSDTPKKPDMMQPSLDNKPIKRPKGKRELIGRDAFDKMIKNRDW